MKRVTTPNSASGSSEDGYLLLAVLVLVALLLISLAIAAPKVAMDLRRDKETEAMHRGMQYGARHPALLQEVRQLSHHHRSTGNIPTKYASLRKRYTDPITGKDDWRLIHLGEAKLAPTGLFGQAMQTGATSTTTGPNGNGTSGIAGGVAHWRNTGSNGNTRSGWNSRSGWGEAPSVRPTRTALPAALASGTTQVALPASARLQGRAWGERVWEAEARAASVSSSGSPSGGGFSFRQQQQRERCADARNARRWNKPGATTERPNNGTGNNGTGTGGTLGAGRPDRRHRHSRGEGVDSGVQEAEAL